jgi:hypothetical protein
MAWAWSTDEAGNYDLTPVFEKFDLMTQQGYSQAEIMEEMSRLSRISYFRHASRASVLRQKTRLAFSDEGVLGWVLHSADAEHSQSAHRVLGNTLWIGFTAFIFVIFFFAAVGAFFAIFEKKHRTALIFLLTTVIGYTLVLLLGVVQARYRLLLYPQLSIFAAYGWILIRKYLRGIA